MNTHLNQLNKKYTLADTKRTKSKIPVIFPSFSEMKSKPIIIVNHEIWIDNSSSLFSFSSINGFC